MTDGASDVAVGDYATDPQDITLVPEPSSLFLLGSGAVAVFVRRRRRNNEEHQQ